MTNINFFPAQETLLAYIRIIFLEVSFSEYMSQMFLFTQRESTFS